jgi:hypothetical protein
MAKSAVNSLEVTNANVRRAENAIRAAGESLVALASDSAFEPFVLLPSILSVAERLNNAVSDTSKLLSQLAASVGNAADERRDTYSERLRTTLAQSGFNPEGTAAEIVVEGRAYLAYDSRSGELRLNDEKVSDLRVGVVVALVKEVLARLSKTATPPAEFASVLTDAYDREVNALGKRPGDQVHIDAVHRQIVWSRQSKTFNRTFKASAYREYTTEMFRSDLYSRLVEGVDLPDGRVLHIDSGADTLGALWMYVPSLARTAFVGRIRLVSP